MSNFYETIVMNSGFPTETAPLHAPSGRGTLNWPSIIFKAHRAAQQYPLFLHE
jgi:hypothetical protein